MMDILQTELDGAVSVLRLNDPGTRNSLSNPMRDALSGAISAAAADPRVEVVYLTGTGDTFCSGGNLAALAALQTPGDVHSRFRNLGTWLLPLMRLEKPFVIGMNGAAVGGGIGLALAGDVVVAASNAKFVSSFFRLGVIPDVTLLYSLPRLIGMARAKAFLFSNGTLTAQEARELGLVAQVVETAALDKVCRAKAHEMAEGPLRAMALAKLLMTRSFETELDTMFLLEGLSQAVAMSDDEFRERVNAFLQKR
jgi:2-(1,2-epoxy-1,2-dihydrophenyl)acetyl-CoA isomerase